MNTANQWVQFYVLEDARRELLCEIKDHELIDFEDHDQQWIDKLLFLNNEYQTVTNRLNAILNQTFSKQND